MQLQLSPAFIPGDPGPAQLPLGRYLPPLPQAIGQQWLQQIGLEPGALVLDPFGAAPQLAVDAARAGHRLLVAVNNPILQLVLEMLATPPGLESCQAVLATLAASRIRAERLEPHIRSLYASHCTQCGAGLQAEAFLWQSGAQAPMAKFYTCPHCGDHGERQVSEGDLLLAKRHAEAGLHQARALERVAPLNDPDRVYVEEALTIYPPRAVYALVTLINKLEGLQLLSGQRRILDALLLLAFERGHTLWPHPSGRERPRQLSIPPLYRENNLWLALEQAVEQWAQPGSPVPLVNWPQLPPPEGGISIFQGRVRDLGPENLSESIQAVLTVLPRPNQAFWTLSALWAGWLWGPDALKGFKVALRRQRYGWGWHTGALHAALENLPMLLAGGTPCLALIGEAEAGFLSAALLAGRLAGLEGQGLAFRQEQAQLHWRIPAQALPTIESETQTNAQRKIETQFSQAAKTLINQAAEPQSFLPLYIAGLLTWAKEPSLPGNDPIENSPAELQSLIHSLAQQALSYRQGFLRFGGSDKNPISGQWYLREPERELAPLSDQVEIAIVNALLDQKEIQAKALDRELCGQFTGLLTPAPELVQACLASYAERHPEADLWNLRPVDRPAQRRQDLEEIGALLAQLAASMSYHLQPVDETRRIIDWHTADGLPAFRFYLSASALLGKIFTVFHQYPATAPAIPQVVLLPGGRANLVAFKLAHNPALQLFFNDNWTFVKFRHWRRLAEDPDLTPQRFKQKLPLDPLTYSEPQLRML